MQIKYLKYLNVLEFLGLTTNKGKTMGLDQYANVRDKQSGQMKSPDFDKVYSDKGTNTSQRIMVSFGESIHVFNNSCLSIWDEQNPDNAEPMNGEDELVITKEIITKLRKEVEGNYHNSFCSGGFFWGHQFQEEAVKQYADLDKQFCDWAEKELDNGNEVIYSCSW